MKYQLSVLLIALVLLGIVQPLPEKKAEPHWGLCEKPNCVAVST